MDENLFTLRAAREADRPYLDAYGAAEGMEPVPDLAEVRVAVNGDDVPVGFLRLQRGSNGAAHVNPVVTCAPWRRYGVGRALMEEALERAGELRFVARGASVPFYERLGYAALLWDAIAPEVAADCDGCPMRGECGPQPMGRTREGSSHDLV